MILITSSLIHSGFLFLKKSNIFLKFSLLDDNWACTISFRCSFSLFVRDKIGISFLILLRRCLLFPLKFICFASSSIILTWLFSKSSFVSQNVVMSISLTFHFFLKLSNISKFKIIFYKRSLINLIS